MQAKVEKPPLARTKSSTAGALSLTGAGSYSQSLASSTASHGSCLSLTGWSQSPTLLFTNSKVSCLFFLTVILVWRLFTGLLMHGDLMTLLFAVLSYLPTAMEVERKIGTVPMIWRFWTCGVLANILFVAVCGIAGMQ